MYIGIRISFTQNFWKEEKEAHVNLTDGDYHAQLWSDVKLKKKENGNIVSELLSKGGHPGGSDHP